LTSDIFPQDRFEVEYSIMFGLGFQRVSYAPHMERIPDQVFFIRRSDGKSIPNGLYKLERAVAYGTVITRVRKTPNGWQLLTPDRP
jgi:hypothetical protein